METVLYVKHGRRYMVWGTLLEYGGITNKAEAALATMTAERDSETRWAAQYKAERDALAGELAALREAEDVRSTALWQTEGLLNDDSISDEERFEQMRPIIRAGLIPGGDDYALLQAELATVRERAEIAETRLATVCRELPGLLDRICDRLPRQYVSSPPGAYVGDPDLAAARAWAARLRGEE